MKKTNRILSVITLILLLASVAFVPCAEADSTSQYTYLEGTRDPFYQPFSSTSIWNMPIGSDAEYVDANLPYTRIVASDGSERMRQVSIDSEHIFTTTTSDELLNIYRHKSNWDNARWPSKELLGASAGTLYWPRGYTVANNTSNNCSAIVQPDRRTVIQIQPTCRVDADSDYITGYNHSKKIDLYGSGEQGTHYGSGLSTIGGSIRKGELIGDQPIRHALKLNINAAEFLYYGEDLKGYKWPADRSDSYAASRYGGKDKNLVMGSLLALPPDITAEDLGITSEVGKKLFFTLQNYGCYITDDSCWNSYCICAEVGVREEVIQKYGEAYDMKGYENAYAKEFVSMVSSLAIIVNNSPDSIGGGGTPRQPLLPEIYPVSSVAFDNDNITIRVGESVNVNATVYPTNATYKKISFKSNANSVVSVDSKGRVIGNGIGVTTISVKTAEGGYTDLCKVTVLPQLVDAEGKLSAVQYSNAVLCALGYGKENLELDMDGNGIINSVDALIIKQKLLGL